MINKERSQFIRIGTHRSALFFELIWTLWSGSVRFSYRHQNTLRHLFKKKMLNKERNKFIRIGTHRCLPRIICRIHLNSTITLILVFTVSKPGFLTNRFLTHKWRFLSGTLSVFKFVIQEESAKQQTTKRFWKLDKQLLSRKQTSQKTFSFVIDSTLLWKW